MGRYKEKPLLEGSCTVHGCLSLFRALFQQPVDDLVRIRFFRSPFRRCLPRHPPVLPGRRPGTGRRPSFRPHRLSARPPGGFDLPGRSRRLRPGGRFRTADCPRRCRRANRGRRLLLRFQFHRRRPLAALHRKKSKTDRNGQKTTQGGVCNPVPVPFPQGLYCDPGPVIVARLLNARACGRSFTAGRSIRHIPGSRRFLVRHQFQEIPYRFRQDNALPQEKVPGQGDITGLVDQGWDTLRVMEYLFDRFRSKYFSLAPGDC